MTPRPNAPIALGITKPCSRMPRPSANAPMIIASVSPTSWIIGRPRNPPADASNPRRTAVATQCTMQRPDRPIAIRSSREVSIDNWRMASEHIEQTARSYNITCLNLGSCPSARRARIAACLMDLTATPSNRVVGSEKRPHALSSLLFFVAGLVFAMVVVGGITRLTESGLSITEWRPISGAIPPLTHSDWERAFDLYRQTPQYKEVAGPAGMTLSGFRFIYFWEWVHRLLARVLGLVFFG